MMNVIGVMIAVLVIVLVVGVLIFLTGAMGIFFLYICSRLFGNGKMAEKISDLLEDLS